MTASESHGVLGRGGGPPAFLPELSPWGNSDPLPPSARTSWDGYSRETNWLERLQGELRPGCAALPAGRPLVSMEMGPTFTECITPSQRESDSVIKQDFMG